MKNLYLLIFISITIGLKAQVQTNLYTYTAGVISSDFSTTISGTSQNSNCPGIFNVPVPSGRYITSIDVEYKIEAIGSTTAWIREQQSYLECVSTGIKESQLTTGPSASTFSGIQQYNRNNLAIANGAVAAGGVNFKLHIFRTWGGSGCNINYQKVPNGSFKITVHHIPLPTCLPPSNLMINNITATSATLNFTSGGAVNWQAEYGPPGFTSGNGTLVNFTTNPFTLQGLSPSTDYEVRVRDSCGPGDVSFWSPTVLFRSSCAILTAPFTEDFESTSWVPGSWNSRGGIDTCYTRNYNSNYTWQTGPPVFSSFSSGPSGDHTTGNGKYIYTEMNSFNPAGSNGEIISPPIDLSSLNVPELSFWYHMFGFNIGTFQFQISNDNGQTYTTLSTKSGQQHSAKSDPWTEVVISLSAYSGDTIQFRLKGTQPNWGFNGDIAIDDISIHESPSCPKPSNLTSQSTSDGFILSWTSGGAANWQIEYGPVGFTPGSGTRVNVSTNPYQFTGLTPNTVYDLYVRDSCGINDVSFWSQRKRDTTLCSVFSTPFTENFDDLNWQAGIIWNDPGAIDMCWNRNDTSGYFWTSGSGFPLTAQSGPAADHTTGSGKFVYTDANGGTNTSTILTTPLFDLNGLNVPQLSFWYHMFGNQIDRLQIEVNNGSGWTTVSTITGQQHTSVTDSWNEKIISLASYANDTIQVRFKGMKQNFGFWCQIALDDVSIGEAPTCPRPSAIQATNTTATSITLNWTSGGATNWLVGYRPSGTGVPLTIVATSSKPFTINNLSPSTTYEFYVKDSCAVNDVSLWEGPFFKSTLCGVAIAPWQESFNGPEWVPGTSWGNVGNVISNCWSRPNTTNPHFGTWQGPTPSFASGPDFGFNGSGKYLYTKSNLTASGIGMIISPSISIPQNWSSAYLKFAYHMYGSNVQNLQVFINKGFGWVNIKTINGQQQSSSSDPWLVDSLDISTYIGETVQLRFAGSINGFFGDISLDEVIVDGVPIVCDSPDSLSIHNISYTSADVNCTSTAMATHLELLAPGQTAGNGQIFNSVSSPYPLTNLLPATTYTIHAWNECSAGILSDTTIASFQTLSCATLQSSFTYSANYHKLMFNNTAANADSVYWHFGDNTFSSLNNPVHTYSAAGIYPVALISYNNCGETDTAMLSIEVCDSIFADFNYSHINDSISLNGIGGPGASEFNWHLPNSITIQGNNPLIYLSPGAHIIGLSVTNNCGDSIYISKLVEACAQPLASWTYKNLGTSGGGMKIEFDGSASANATTYEWDFGDGNTNSGSVKPIHIYAVPTLNYTVSLKVTNACGEVNILTYRLNQISLIENISSRGISFYPNPAEDILYMKVSGQEEISTYINVFDLSGKQIDRLSIQTRDQEQRIDISQWPKGIYILKPEGNYPFSRIVKQ